jgi:hypothetical protein
MRGRKGLLEIRGALRRRKGRNTWQSASEAAAGPQDLRDRDPAAHNLMTQLGHVRRSAIGQAAAVPPDMIGSSINRKDNLMHKYTFTAFVFATVCASSSLLAQGASKPVAGLEQLSVFEGDRNCAGTVFASQTGTDHATTGSVHGAKAVGGHWLYLAYDGATTAAQSTAYHFAAFVGYDARRNVFVQVGVDNSGYGYQISTSAGRSGDTMTFEGSQDMNGKSILQRDNYISKGADELIHVGETQNSDGKWVKTDEETCKLRQ